MVEDIYEHSIPHLKVKTAQRNIQPVEPIPRVPKTILYKYKEVTICCDLTHINGIGFLNTIPRYIMFSTGSIKKTEKLRTWQMGPHRYISYT